MDSPQHLTVAKTARVTFLSLPPELRLTVYSSVILPPNRRRPETRPERISTANRQKVIDDLRERKICHESAKALRATCKQIYHETAQQFYMCKSVFLHQPVDRKLHPEVRRLEFGLDLKIGDVVQNEPIFRKELAKYDHLLRGHLNDLKSLESVTFRITETNDDFPPCNKPFCHSDAPGAPPASAAPSNKADLAGFSRQWITEWGVRRPMNRAVVETFLSHTEPFNNYSRDNGLLSESNGWWRTSHMSSSHWMCSANVVVNEIRFERKSAEEMKKLKDERESKQRSFEEVDDDEEDEE